MNGKQLRKKSLQSFKSLQPGNLKRKLFLLLSVAAMNSYAQTGYIYIHKKALDESSSVDFTFNATGGSTVIPSVVLNDQPANITLRDIGAAQNGRLWAIGNNFNLYYRDASSATWVQTGITNASRVDGGAGNLAYVVRTNGQVIAYDGTTATALYTGSDAADIGSRWDSQPYIITTAGSVYTYSGSGTTWSQLTAAGTNNVKIDGNPNLVNTIVVAKSDGNVYSINTSSGISTSLGRPTSITSNNATDVGVDANGSAYAIYTASASGSTFVYKWSSGTAWSAAESTSRSSYTLTGGLGGQMWAAITNASANPAAGNIWSRAFDGTNSWWIDDERVRTSATGNSMMIPVTPGSYTFTETVPSGWDLQGILIYDPGNNSTKNLSAKSFTANVSAGEVVHVIVSNGVINPYTMTNDCGTAYIESFGTGAVGTFGPAFLGQTSYHYLNTSTGTMEGYYKIIGNASQLYGGGFVFNDHTAGDGQGRMLAVDAGQDVNEFFRRRFNGLIVGVQYDFSAWLAPINASGINPNITFSIIDHTTYDTIAQNNTGNLALVNGWTKQNLTFTATTTSVDLVIRNNSVGGSGNDLAIDDIEFKINSVTPVTTVTNSSCSSPTGTITVTAPLGTAYEYNIDGGPWQSSVAFTGLVPGNHIVAARYAGTTNCAATKTDTIKAALCGNVFHDANGNVLINTGETFTTLPFPMYVYLVNSSGIIVDSAAVAANGSYELNAAVGSTYAITLSTGVYAIGTNTGTTPVNTTLPANWMNTGENANGTIEGTANGIMNVPSVSGNLSNFNFGIQQRPVADPKSYTVPESAFSNTAPSGFPSPAGYKFIQTSSSSLTGTTGGALSGSDPEDCSAASSCNSGSTFRITAINSNTLLFYDFGGSVGVQQIDLSSGPVTIANYDASKLVIAGQDGTGNSGNPVGFSYAIVDQAGSAAPAVAYQIVTTTPLPVNLAYFKISEAGKFAQLDWTTYSEHNSKGFEIQRSADASAWTHIGFTASKGNTGAEAWSYSFTDKNPSTGINYYRLKLVDQDGRYAYSEVQQIHFGLLTRTITVTPNPVRSSVTINGLSGEGTLTLINAVGQNIWRKAYSGGTLTIDMSAYPAGSYFILIKEGTKTNSYKVVKE
ncbi:MAG: T9SS type A sorting domain-containing protein [Taibaiella sp.]|nr:T9SS type A sorting domain-containing protein [Taibaiella sp.]